MHSADTPRPARWWLIGTAAAIALAASSCASDGDIDRDPPSASGVRATVIAGDAGKPNDAITIDSIRVAGDTLVALVSHGGGCADHTYQLVIGTAWMESFPVQVRARIAHDANGDVCRALLRRTLRMDLLPLAAAYRAAYHQQQGTVDIQLPGPTPGLRYVF